MYAARSTALAALLALALGGCGGSSSHATGASTGSSGGASAGGSSGASTGGSSGASTGGSGGASGSTSSAAPSDKPEAVVSRWLKAATSRDVSEACSLMSGKAQATLRREIAQLANAGGTGSSCPDVIGALYAALSPQRRSELAAATPAQATIAGDEAKVLVGSATFLLTRSGGRWLISEVPLGA